MKKSSTNDSILNDVNKDVNQIITGVTQLPWRDGSGKRFFNLIVENRIIRFYENTVSQLQKAINKTLGEQTIGEITRHMLSTELQKATDKYTEDQQADESKLADIDSQLEKLEQEVASTPTHVEDDVPKNKDKKRKSKGLLSFLLVAFIAEFVAFLATFNLQQENLSTEAIWWRLAYIGVIYVYTIILYLKYVKTRILVIKGLLIGCILLGFVCLLHAIAVTFLNLDVVTTASASFDLNQIEPIEAEDTSDILSNLISRPGLVEFLCATLLVFTGEIVTIDSKKTEVSEDITETISISTDELGSFNFDEANRQITLQHIAILKGKRSKLLERCNKRTKEFNNYVNSINAQREANEQKMEQAQTDLDKYQQEKETLLDKVVSDLAGYRTHLLEKLAFRLAVEKSSFKYEPATKSDVKVYYNL